MGKRRFSVPGDWKPCRNPLAEQMHEMPPPTYRKGRLEKARTATYDPSRGEFVSLARPESPEKGVPKRGRGVRFLPHLKAADHLQVIMAFEQNMREPVPMPPIHRKRPPEGTRLVGDIPKCLRLDEPTSDDVAFKWEKYKRALERAMKREGEEERISWRNRATKEPVSPEQSGCTHHRRHFYPPPGAETAGALCSREDALSGKENSAKVPHPPPRSQGRRPYHGPAARSVGKALLTGAGFDMKRPRPAKLPPSWRNGPHMDALLDDDRARNLVPPVTSNQRKHLTGPPSKIYAAISPIDPTDRRALCVRAMRELTLCGHRG